MDFQTALMDVLKSRYIEIVGQRGFGGCDSPTQAQYYLARIEDNLVMPMSERHAAEYGRGSGNELGGKMKSLRSSSAMTFNLLGNGPVSVKGDDTIPAGTYEVAFECQFPTLGGNPNPANLDARLMATDGSCAVYCEMKLAEWIFGKAPGLRPQYLEAGNYLMPKPAAETFVNMLESLTVRKADSSGRLMPVLGRYDAFQMAKHLLAIYTECVRIVESGGTPPPKIVLANCIWEMAHPEKLGKHETKYRALEVEEHDQFRRFAEAARPAAALFADLGADFELRYYPFTRFLDLLDLTPAHVAALERYVI